MGPDRYGRTHEEIEELLAVYALDAVPEDERRAVEEHLATCTDCRAEVEEHRATAAMLASAGGPAPPALWGRIADAIEPPGTVNLEARRQRSTGPRPGGLGRWAATVAAAAAVVAIAALGLKVIQQERILDRLVATNEEAGLIQAANAALLDSRGSRVALTSEDGGVVVDVVVLPDGTGYLLRNDLRPLPPGRTYQLWALDDGNPISVGVLGRNPRVMAFSVDPRVVALAITEERSGGAVSPRSDPLALGDVQTS